MVPHMLTEEQKQKRVHWCHFMPDKFDGGRSNAVWDIISGDETWVYCLTLKQSSSLSNGLLSDRDPLRNSSAVAPLPSK